ncbi:hypothetical protein NYZ99_03720 [Maribacter litopenaei]|uniref:Uncharacterized protein n=1 Tax=Maribacter litopenaei TaxID=2976127 RepID=A0ABY5Y9L6_9FLAO|nr:hypothetical protein [Maribacter litopenaei]UWX55594.1 hypothetical protein NYZ99_03720 [Maribacter litopenaei]
MKINIKNLVLSVFSAGLILSCETTELDLISDPNAVSPEQATPRLLFKQGTRRICKI